MPNHVTTRCIITGNTDEITRFRNQMIRPEERTKLNGDPSDPVMAFDFNAIIPMPEILKTSEASTTAEFGAELVLLRSERQYSFSSRAHAIPSAWLERIKTECGVSEDERLDIIAAAYLSLHPDWEDAGRNRLEAIAQTGYASWYDWALAHWNTKWGAYDFSEVSNAHGRYEFTFNTAWSFPLPVFEALSALFSKLAFQCVCFDDGSHFAGEGFFNPPEGAPAFSLCDATDELYEIVYGQPPEKEDDYELRVHNSSEVA